LSVMLDYAVPSTTCKPLGSMMGTGSLGGPRSRSARDQGEALLGREGAPEHRAARGGSYQRLDGLATKTDRLFRAGELDGFEPTACRSRSTWRSVHLRYSDASRLVRKGDIDGLLSGKVGVDQD
jgi:hypothetical protein